MQPPRISRLLMVCIALLGLAYLAQTPSRLRINTDAIVLLGIGASAADGHGFLYQGQPTHFPPGYPAIIAGLDKLGLASSQTFILVNCLFLGVMLYSAYRLYRDTLGMTGQRALGLCCLVGLSFVLIKHTTIPVSDTAAGGMMLATVLLLTRVRDANGKLCWGWLFGSVVAVCLTIATRTVGIALLPPLVFALSRPLVHNLNAVRHEYPRLFGSCVLGILGLGALCGFVIMRSRYAHEMLDLYLQQGLVGRICTNMRVHLTELGQITINIPGSKLPQPATLALIPIGAATFILSAAALWRRRSDFGCMEVSLLSYAGIIFLWPYEDVRFWLMVLPLLAAYVAISAQTLTRWLGLRVVLIAGCLWYAAMGVIALGYSTRISWAGDRFSELYGDGTLRSTFRAAYLHEQSDDIRSDALALIKRFDRAAKPVEGSR